MNWQTLLIIAVLCAAGWLIRRLALMSPRHAHRCLDRGAVIIDVRNPEEFSHGHIASAINLPLSTLPQSAASRFSDKTQVLLLHCAAGGRSAVAKRVLRAHGYAHAYNLGSYGRAERIGRTRHPARQFA